MRMDADGQEEGQKHESRDYDRRMGLRAASGNGRQMSFLDVFDQLDPGERAEASTLCELWIELFQHAKERLEKS